MRLALVTRKKKPEPQAAAELFEASEDEAVATPVASAGQVVSAGLMAQVIHLALVLCLVAGPVGLAMGWLALNRRAPAAAAVTQSGQTSAADADIAGLFAAEVVTTWLTASRADADKVASVLPGLSTGTLPNEPFKVRDVVVGQVAEVGPGLFSVTVGVTVTDSSKTTVRRHYQVPVQVSAGTVAAAAMPALVALPPIAGPPSLSYRTRLDSGSDEVTAAGQFLSAYLTGQAEVARYVSPGVQIEPVSPAPFTAVKVGDVYAAGVTPAATDGARVQLQIQVTGTVTVQQSVTVSYWLTLAARGGRWEIASIDSQPATAPIDSRRSPTPGSTKPAK